jgi:hypothetical protein
MNQRIRGLVLIPLAALALAGCGGGTKPHPIVVGAVEDAAKSSDAGAKMQLAAQAGFKAIALSAVWTPPLVEPAPSELARLRTAVGAAAAAGITPIVAVYSFSSDTPLTDAARSQFAAFAASIVRDLPQVRDISVGNEPNLNLFWLPQFASDGSDAAASSYLALLAQSYDAIKAVAPAAQVIGGSLAPRGSDKPKGARQTHSPTQFIEDLGAAYRASGRTKPVMDLFSIHPYPESSAIPPDFQHPHSTSIGLADYDKLVKLLDGAFGTAPPIVYGEYGVETTIPASEQSAYTGAEPASTRAVSIDTQGTDYVEAMRFATCQPLVRMLLFFHVSDEPDLARLQTGMYYADDKPKPDLTDVATAAKAAETGQLKCSP